MDHEANDRDNTEKTESAASTGTPTDPERIVGRAAGVPFVAVPPATGARPDAPAVVAWHLQDPPRSETALAAALPLDGLDAWRIYLGLPLSGSRLPEGGWDEVMRMGMEDAVLQVHRPVVYGAVEEFGPAWAELRDRLGLDTPSPQGVLGGSIGSAVTQALLAEGELDVTAAVLVSPVAQLRAAVDAVGRRFGVVYPWSDPSDAVAERLDFVARAPEIVSRNPRLATLLVVGEEDDRAGFLDPSLRLRDRLREASGADDRAERVTVPGMGHALADEPGIDPAPQTPHAAAVDRHAVQWFQRHLATSR